MKKIILVLSILMSMNTFAKLGHTTIKCESDSIELSIKYKNDFSNRKVVINEENFELTKYQTQRGGFSLGGEYFRIALPIEKGEILPPKYFSTELEVYGEVFKVDCKYNPGLLFWGWGK